MWEVGFSSTKGLLRDTHFYSVFYAYSLTQQVFLVCPYLRYRSFISVSTQILISFIDVSNKVECSITSNI